MDLRVRNRHRLRDKEVQAFADSMARDFGTAFFSPADHVDRAEAGDVDVLLLRTRVAAIVQRSPERVIPSLHTLLAKPAAKGWVTVDMGAVRFVTNGADVMGPGIVDADPAIAAGALAWIRDEKNKRALAVGEALAAGSEMAKKPGKQVRTLHWIGDKVWTWEA